MTEHIYTNFATSTLSAAIAADAEAFTINSPSIGVFPSPAPGQLFACRLKHSDPSYSAYREVIYVESRSGNDFSEVSRNQEGTTGPPTGWPAGTQITVDLTAAQLTRLARKPERESADEGRPIVVADWDKILEVNSADLEVFYFPSVGSNENEKGFGVRVHGDGNVQIDIVDDGDTIGPGGETSVTLISKGVIYWFEYRHVNTNWMIDTPGDIL